MALQLRKSEQPYYQTKSKPVKRGSYLSFLHSLPCVVTGTRDRIEAAHISFANPKLGHYGRGKGTKAPDRWAIPVCADEHRRSHSMNEAEYWRSAGINPHLIALVIFGLWSDLGDEAAEKAEAVIRAVARQEA